MISALVERAVMSIDVGVVVLVWWPMTTRAGSRLFRAWSHWLWSDLSTYGCDPVKELGWPTFAVAPLALMHTVWQGLGLVSTRL